MPPSKQYIQGISLLLDDLTEGDPTQPGQEKYDSGSFRQMDSVGVFNPRTVWAGAHESVCSLAHVLGEGVGASTTCIITGSPFITQRAYYTDSTLTKLLAKIAFTRNAKQICTQRVTTVYKSDGVTIAATATDSFQFDTKGFPTGFTRTLS